MSTNGTQGQPRLESFAQELGAIIAEYLDLPALCNLRLCRRVFSVGCYSVRFQSFFKNLDTDMTVESLQRLSQIAEDPVLGLAVQSLTVLAVIDDVAKPDRILETKRRCIHECKDECLPVIRTFSATEEELEEAHLDREAILIEKEEQEELSLDDSDIQLLADVLKTVGTLGTLNIEGVAVHGNHVYDYPDLILEWHPMWLRSSQFYRTVMLAIGHSGIAIEHLNIYTTCERYSVQTWDTNKYMPELESSNFATAAKHIKSFSLSISPRVKAVFKKILDARAADYTRMGSDAGLLSEQDPSVVAEGDYPSIDRLVKHMPNLERLDLHLYRVLEDPANNYATVLSYIADDVVLPSLRHCILRGLPSNEDSLLKFFQNHGELETLELREMNLVSGSWTRIFAHLCTLPSLKHVVLGYRRAPKNGQPSSQARFTGGGR